MTESSQGPTSLNMLGLIAKRLRLFLKSELDLFKDRLIPGMNHHLTQERFEAGLRHALWMEGRTVHPLHKASHRVYSQFGEDGVIQYLIQKVPIENDTFIEIGVEDYSESNTRFLLEKDDWRGLIVDYLPDADDFLEKRLLKLRHTIEFKQTMVTRGKINEILKDYAGDIGLLSIDVDGVDYFLWEALEVVSPRIVVAEYQSNFGPDLAISTPYRDDFDRTKHHYTNLAAGPSLAALNHIANKKGYALVGRSNQHNAFFVRRDVLGDIPEATVSETYRAVRFRESKDRSGNLTYLSTMEERRNAMKDAVVVDVITGREMTIAEAFRL